MENLPPQTETQVSKRVPSFYVNNYQLGCSNADVFVILSRASEQEAVVYMSFGVAKSLAEKLNLLISSMEKQFGQEILSSDKIAISLNAIEAGEEK